MENLDGVFWPIAVFVLYFLARVFVSNKSNRANPQAKQVKRKSSDNFTPFQNQNQGLKAEKATRDMLKNLATHVDKEVQVLNPRKKDIQVLDPVDNEVQILEYGNKDVQVLDNQIKSGDQSSTKKHVLELMEREKSISIEKGRDENFEEESQEKLEEVEEGDFFFNEDVILQGFIFSEVLGKPKSLRK